MNGVYTGLFIFLCLRCTNIINIFYGGAVHVKSYILFCYLAAAASHIYFRKCICVYKVHTTFFIIYQIYFIHTITILSHIFRGYLVHIHTHTHKYGIFCYCCDALYITDFYYSVFSACIHNIYMEN